MSVLPNFGRDTGKRCFAYCGDDRCNCGASNELAALLAMPARPSEEELRKPRFFPSHVGRQTA